MYDKRRTEKIFFWFISSLWFLSCYFSVVESWSLLEKLQIAC